MTTMKKRMKRKRDLKKIGRSMRRSRIGCSRGRRFTLCTIDSPLCALLSKVSIYCVTIHTSEIAYADTLSCSVETGNKLLSKHADNCHGQLGPDCLGGYKRADGNTVGVLSDWDAIVTWAREDEMKLLKDTMMKMAIDDH